MCLAGLSQPAKQHGGGSTWQTHAQLHLMDGIHVGLVLERLAKLATSLPRTRESQGPRRGPTLGVAQEAVGDAHLGTYLLHHGLRQEASEKQTTNKKQSKPEREKSCLEAHGWRALQGYVCLSPGSSHLAHARALVAEVWSEPPRPPHPCGRKSGSRLCGRGSVLVSFPAVCLIEGPSELWDASGLHCIKPCQLLPTAPSSLRLTLMGGTATNDHASLPGSHLPRHAWRDIALTPLPVVPLYWFAYRLKEHKC